MGLLTECKDGAWERGYLLNVRMEPGNEATY